jgi:hypothetical protein
MSAWNGFTLEVETAFCYGSQMFNGCHWGKVVVDRGSSLENRGCLGNLGIVEVDWGRGFNKWGNWGIVVVDWYCWDNLGCLMGKVVVDRGNWGIVISVGDNLVNMSHRGIVVVGRDNLVNWGSMMEHMGCRGNLGNWGCRDKVVVDGCNGCNRGLNKSGFFNMDRFNVDIGFFHVDVRFSQISS